MARRRRELDRCVFLLALVLGEEGGELGGVIGTSNGSVTTIDLSRPCSFSFSFSLSFSLCFRVLLKKLRNDCIMREVILFYVKIKIED